MTFIRCYSLLTPLLLLIAGACLCFCRNPSPLVGGGGSSSLRSSAACQHPTHGITTSHSVQQPRYYKCSGKLAARVPSAPAGLQRSSQGGAAEAEPPTSAQKKKS